MDIACNHIQINYCINQLRIEIGNWFLKILISEEFSDKSETFYFPTIFPEKMTQYCT